MPLVVLTDVTVMDGGSAYAIGNRLHVVGIATTTTLGVHIQRLLQVTEIYDNTGDVVRLTGVTSETYNQFNSLYRITEIDVGAAKSFRAAVMCLFLVSRLQESEQVL